MLHTASIPRLVPGVCEILQINGVEGWVPGAYKIHTVQEHIWELYP